MREEKIYIFDTTLRDGEQVPGCQLNTIEKIEIAKMLEELGVDVIEAGFPISSPGDFQSVVEISRLVRKPVVCALTRAKKEDIDCASEALRFAKRKRIHTGIGVSDIHIKYKFNSTREKILQQAIWAVQHAKKRVDEVEFYAEDAGRADNQFLAQIIEEVIKAGAGIINIPDTTGYCLPEEFGSKIRFLKENVRNIDKAIISIHCHNDLGLATANTIAGLVNGARQAEVTINGVGERAGNTSLEEVVTILKTHKKTLGLTSEIKTKKIYPASRLVSRLMRMPIQPNKAIVGRNAFAHSAGIHQHGVLRHRLNYEIINPKDIGIPSSRIILTARSGRAALKYHLEKLGYQISEKKLEEVYQNFLALADKKREINDEDLHFLMGNSQGRSRINLVSINVTCGNNTIPTAAVKLKIGKKEKIATGYGNGPIDAVFKAINKIVNKKIFLEEFLVQSLSGGSDDIGKVHTQIRYKRKIYYGFGADYDIVVASAKSYLNAINKII